MKLLGSTKPISIPAHLVPHLQWGRVRALALPLSQFGMVQPRDTLWVREGITVLDRQRRANELSLCYAGEAKRYHLPWPSVIAKPGPGYRPPEAMPVQASRITLWTERVQQIRLRQIDEDTSLVAGLWPEGDGYSVHGYPFLEPFDDHTKAICWAYERMFPGAGRNPEVALIEFRVIERNISVLAAGFPKGAA